MYLRAKDAAKRLGLSTQTLARWRVEGSPIPYSRIGRTILYDLADLEAFIQAGRRSSTSENVTGAVGRRVR